MKEFFSGSIKQHQERCARLMERIPRNLPREFHALAQKCRDELQQLHDNLGMLLKDTRKMLVIDYADDYVTITRNENLKQGIKLIVETMHM